MAQKTSRTASKKAAKVTLATLNTSTGPSKKRDRLVAQLRELDEQVASGRDARRRMFEEQEGIITNNREALPRIAEALTIIHTERLYEEQYGSFGEYVSERWGWTRGYAYNLMKGHQHIAVVKEMVAGGEIQASGSLGPVYTTVDNLAFPSMSAVMPLNSLSAKERKDAIKKAYELAGDEVPQVTHFSDAAALFAKKAAKKQSCRITVRVLVEPERLDELLALLGDKFVVRSPEAVKKAA
jgi:hypothetical protein